MHARNIPPFYGVTKSVCAKKKKQIQEILKYNQMLFLDWLVLFITHDHVRYRDRIRLRNATRWHTTIWSNDTFVWLYFQSVLSGLCHQNSDKSVSTADWQNYNQAIFMWWAWADGYVVTHE